MLNVHIFFEMFHRNSFVPLSMENAKKKSWFTRQNEVEEEETNKTKGQQLTCVMRNSVKMYRSMALL